ncbi:TOBE domain-containing protein [Halopenitus sp. POP-27]|uniref:TOBE domain-containing protein n=1 Tax=Halopenitus sp. POP-27 TaxID=2994425 RepID=UPI00246889CC|nr:TOBE domain-containing protein [Halopenitus sp. POP-27]
MLTADGVEFGERDAALLQAIDRTGSVATASAKLERSRARALTRIETLEEGFGTLVERTRGGSGGGGSQLTPTAETLLTRYDRLQAALTAAAQVPETVLQGTVTAVDGELATAETSVGEVRALRERNAIEDGDAVQLRIGADAVTLSAADGASDPDSTSARNRVRGTVTEVAPGETVRTVTIDVDGTTVTALVTSESASRLSLAGGRIVVATWKATATRMVPGRSSMVRENGVSRNESE